MPPGSPPALRGDELPSVRSRIPGPASTELARRLARVESRNVTCLAEPGPIFWTEAHGANVRDADGNVYVDLTAGFGVAAAGHANERVVAAIANQAATLAQALGDVYPAEIKVRLLERLASIAPGSLCVSILASAGAEAVEAALKTAVLRTGRAGVLAFEGAYHGLTYGALAATWRAEFREPFRAQLMPVSFAPFPTDASTTADALLAARALLTEAEDRGSPIGAILVEPILGRGGIVVPAPGFLAGLRALCDGVTCTLIFDEVYTGMGRTGRWFACEHWSVVPDLLVVGKALAGSLPISAAIGTPEVMAAWPPSTGEAIHTSTFLGNPIACAAALAQLDEIEKRGLLERATAIGQRIRARADVWRDQFTFIRGVRGLGALQGLVMEDGLALETSARALQQGVLVLAEGDALQVLALTPPLVISDAQLDAALLVVERALHELRR